MKTELPTLPPSITFRHILVTIAFISAGSSLALAQGSASMSPANLAQTLGVSFPSDSNTTVVLSKDGKQYVIDVAARTVTEIQKQPQSGSQGPQQGANLAEAATVFSKNCAACHGTDGRGLKSVGTPNFADAAFQTVSSDEIERAIRNGKGPIMPAWSTKLSNGQISDLVAYIRSLAPTGTSSSGSNVEAQEQAKAAPRIYQPGDDVLVTLPTGRPTDRHGVYVNFAHRFPYQPAFTGTNEGATLFGLDNVAIPSFGFRYGLTDNLMVSVFRAPSLVNRPIQLMAGYNILEERKEDPFNLMVRVSVEGQDNFRKNYTENIELILSRSITHRAQVYIVPTISFNDRRLIQPNTFASSSIFDEPGVNAFSLGAGLAVDIRPTVALLAESIPTLVNSRELDIHRPVFSFGIQKKIWRHAFTLGLTTSPGTTVSQRASTVASFLNQPSADTFSHLFIGFDLTRQIK
jgi:mono/diheme cytochrome c family protein